MKKIHGNFGRKHTKEWKLKMSIKNSGKSNPFYGKKHTPETIVKVSGENHHNWKGDKAKYKAIHIWINIHKGRPNFCEHCDRDIPYQDYEWANIDHKYKRNLNDWIRVCPKCHSDYDVKNGLRDYFKSNKNNGK